MTAPQPEPPPPEAAAAPRHQTARWRRWLLLVVSLAAVTALRLHSLEEPLEGDEATYMLMARLWADGGTPYADLWDNKPIGTFITYRIGLGLFGYDHYTPRMLSLLAMLVSTALLAWVLWRRPPAEQLLGLLVLWPMLTVWVPCHANGANMEVFLLPFLFGLFGLLERYIQTRKEAYWYAALAVVCTSLLLKQVTLPLVAVPFAVLPRSAWRQPRRLAGRGLALLGLLVVLPALVYTGFGLGPLFPFRQFAVNASYGSDIGPWRRLLKLVVLALSLPFHRSLLWLLPLSLAAILGTIGAIVRRQPGRWLLLSLPAGSVAAVVLPGQHSGHYSLLALPAIVLAVLAGYDLSRRRPWRVVLPILAFAFLGFWTWKQYLSLEPRWISAAKYPENPAWFVGDRHIGNWLREQGITDKRIYVEGSHASIYFYSRNRPATRFHCQYAVPIGAVTQEELLQQTIAAEPDYLIMLNPTPALPGITPWIEAEYTLDQTLPALNVRVYRRVMRQ